MNSKWTKTKRQDEVLDCHAPRGPRIIALVFLAPFAVFFGYYLIASLAEYIRAANPNEWLRAVPGLLVVLALFLSFGIPSWWLLLGRTRLIFDRGNGRILQVFDFPSFAGQGGTAWMMPSWSIRRSAGPGTKLPAPDPTR